MPAPSSSQIRVGPRLAFTVLWTVVSVIGLGLGLLVGVPGLADLVQRGSASTTEAKTLVVAVAVGMFLTGAYGIMASHRNLKHSVDLIVGHAGLPQRFLEDPRDSAALRSDAGRETPARRVWRLAALSPSASIRRPEAAYRAPTFARSRASRAARA